MGSAGHIRTCRFKLMVQLIRKLRFRFQLVARDFKPDCSTFRFKSFCPTCKPDFQFLRSVLIFVC